MTQKELLYVEDAIGHENTIIEICRDITNNLQEEDLKSFMDEQLEKHEKLKKDLLNMLEVKSND